VPLSGVLYRVAQAALLAIATAGAACTVSAGPASADVFICDGKEFYSTKNGLLEPQLPKPHAMDFADLGTIVVDEEAGTLSYRQFGKRGVARLHILQHSADDMQLVAIVDECSLPCGADFIRVDPWEEPPTFYWAQLSGILTGFCHRVK